MSRTENITRPREHADCLARSIFVTLAENPSLEAVTIDRTHKNISVATLGRADAEQLERSITSQFQRAQEMAAGSGCSLLTGAGDCHSCRSPLTESELKIVSVQHSGCTTTIARITCPTAPKFWRWRNLPFPRVVQRDVEFLEHADHDHDHHHDHADEWKMQLALAAACGVLGLLAAYVVPESWRIPTFLLSYLAGAWFPAEEVWERLRQRAIDVHFLMLAVAAGSASIGAWGEGATLLFLFSLSGALEHYALGRTQKEIRSLFHDAPKTATVLDNAGNEREVAVPSLTSGMRLLVKPGSQFPVDAEVLKGATATDESNLTGESTPVEKKTGDTVLAGTINLWGAVEVSVLRPAAESALQKIIRLIKEAQHQKAPSQRFTDRFSTVYTYLVLALSAAMFFVWWLALGLSAFESTPETRSAFYRTMTLLVVASPCALVLSIPSAVLAAIACGARHGILIRGGAAVEKLADVNVVALDKTGTLTTGELRVEQIQSFPAGRENEVAQLVFSLEKLSTHPLARAITRYGKRQNLTALTVEQFQSVTGQGLRGLIGGSETVAGRREWVIGFRKRNDGSEISTVRTDTDAGFSEVWVSGNDLLGRVVLRDDIRPQARNVLDELRSAGLRAVVLTGDRTEAAAHLKSALQLDDIRAQLKPEEKVAAIKAFNDAGDRVAMIGDGVNDAPSLAAAHIGVAMGARGSDAALEQADVVLMHDRLENFHEAYRLSQRAQRIIRQNLFVSLGTVAVLVVFALIGKIPLPLGVVGHEGSTVIVVMNSLRLLLGSKRQR